MWSEENKYSNAWNFGPDYKDMKKVEWIIESLINKWKGGVNWRVDNNNQPHEANNLKLDCSKARSQLNWMPALDINDSLNWTVDWYKNYYGENNIKQLTLRQIKDYQERVG